MGWEHKVLCCFLFFEKVPEFALQFNQRTLLCFFKLVKKNYFPHWWMVLPLTNIQYHSKVGYQSHFSWEESCISWYEILVLLDATLVSREYRIERRELCLARRELCLARRESHIERRDSCLVRNEIHWSGNFGIHYWTNISREKKNIATCATSGRFCRTVHVCSRCMSWLIWFEIIFSSFTGKVSVSDIQQKSWFAYI